MMSVIVIVTLFFIFGITVGVIAVIALSGAAKASPPLHASASATANSDSPTVAKAMKSAVVLRWVVRFCFIAGNISTQRAIA